tara:strand:+ start:146 stop:418 length:273 start_codon:yes stop_codon:yes gene_type:complete
LLLVVEEDASAHLILLPRVVIILLVIPDIMVVIFMDGVGDLLHGVILVPAVAEAVVALVISKEETEVLDSVQLDIKSMHQRHLLPRLLVV